MSIIGFVSVWRHVRAIGFLPVMVCVFVPAVIVWRDDELTVGFGLLPALPAVPAAVGIALVAAGLALVVSTIALFARAGGTLAPWDPTDSLVVRGPYRRVRNPMITGVLTILLGEATLFGSASLLIWFATSLALNLIYIPRIEEPDLEERFGPDYETYRTHVPRWIPRLRAWNPKPTRRPGP